MKSIFKNTNRYFLFLMMLGIANIFYIEPLAAQTTPGPVTAQISCGQPTKNGNVKVKFKLSCGPVTHVTSVTGILATDSPAAKAAKIAAQVNADIANQNCAGAHGITASQHTGPVPGSPGPAAPNKVDLKSDDSNITIDSLEVVDGTGQSGTFTPRRTTGAIDMTVSGSPSSGLAMATFNKITVSVATRGLTSTQVVTELSNKLRAAGIVNNLVPVSMLLDPTAIRNTVAIRIPPVTGWEEFWIRTTDVQLDAVMQMNFQSTALPAKTTYPKVSK